MKNFNLPKRILKATQSVVFLNVGRYYAMLQHRASFQSVVSRFEFPEFCGRTLEVNILAELLDDDIKVDTAKHHDALLAYTHQLAKEFAHELLDLETRPTLPDEEEQ